jgi:signal transduction histidine kinase
VVTLILLIVCSSIYYFSDLNRQRDFKKRLRNRALTTVNLLFRVQGINNTLLRRIDETTVITIQDKSVVIYDDSNKELYSYTDSMSTPVRVDSEILQKARRSGEYTFRIGRREALVINQQNNTRKYTIVAAAYDKDGLDKLSQLLVILSISFVSGILITFFSGLAFSSTIVLPIKKITKEVKEISSQHLSRRIPLSESKDELNELSNTFNDLLRRLEESFEIQRHFIANASHELSTPLTSISSQLEITLQNQRSADEYRSILFSVYEDVKNLNQLTRSLLEIAKASGTTEGIELTLVRMDELLMKLPADLRKINNVFQADMHFDNFPENEDNLLVFGNPDLLYSAIKNIVLNACKYSSNHTAIISLSFNADTLHIIIKDNGPGISEEERKMIFQPFYRGRGINTTQGFGLGLSLALSIITLHKGKIELLPSLEENIETVFSIYFPIARTFHKL